MMEFEAKAAAIVDSNLPGLKPQDRMKIIEAIAAALKQEAVNAKQRAANRLADGGAGQDAINEVLQGD